MDEYDTLLLSAIHKGDINSLKTHLLSISDPYLYVNRLYDQLNGQKCTLLMIACLTGHDDIVYMLLDNFKLDLEVSNIIQIYNDDQELEIYEDITILWAAAAIDNFSIVKRLIEHAANVNHTTKTNSTALRCTCSSGNVEMARYLIDNGADIKINKRNNETNLVLAVYRGHLKMTTYLVDELNCNVNECDGDGFSPLYFAVKCGSIEIVQFLLNHGARNISMANNEMSPLMLAAEYRRNDLMDIIAPYCSLLESIEAEELLGSAFACAERGPCNLEKSFEHFYRALELRSIHNLPKVLRESTHEVFNNRQECQTIDQLENFRLNLDHMYTESLLVRERLLGPTNNDYHYSLIYRGVILAENAQYHHTIAIWLYELELCRHHSMLFYPEDIRYFVKLFCDMICASSSIPIKALLIIAAKVVEQMKQNKETINDNLNTLLFLTTIISHPSVDTLLLSIDRQVFYRFIYSVNQDRYFTSNNGSSLLHLSLSEFTSASDSSIDQVCKYPCLRTIRTLLHCGADVNAIDSIGNTPLHIYALNTSICDEDIFQHLCDAGAHLDTVNNLRGIPIVIASNSKIKQLLKVKMKINLKCICARLIQMNSIRFHGKISNSLVNFVEKH